jgi:hypothetical protein
MKKEFRLFNRREFFAGSASTMAILSTIAAERGSAAEKGAANPFAYDLTRLQKTDPKLIAYEETARWHSPHAEARRLGIAPDGQLLVASGNYVTAMTADGQRGLEIALTEPARAIAAAKDGTVYIGLRDHVEVFDAKGQRKAAWDSPGKKTWFTGLAVTENDVFAADAGGRILLRYDRSGKLVKRIGEKNQERNVPGFIVPSPFFDVELHRDGLLRVNNPGRHRVEAYTVDGDFEFAWGSPSMGITGFCGCCNPINLALLPDGKYITCEKGLPRVKIYGSTGEFESVVAGAESFAENAKACGPADCTAGGLDAVADAQGRIFILDYVTGNVRVMRRKQNA